MSAKPKLIQRYTSSDRVNHGLLALSFILVAMSGMAFFHPSLYWLSAFFGGGEWARVLHPLLGVAMFVFFFIAMVKYWKHNLLTGNDFKWLGRLGDVMKNREENLPPIGKYNPGQKLLFWTLVVTMILLLLTGIALWQPWFAPLFPIGVVRAAAVIHVISAVVLLLGMIVHIYSAIFWIKGSTRAMLRGTVTETWARKHHPLWYEEMTSGQKK
ncbi:Formate dehydrogenase O gamma subunit [Thioalkalivibrio nitratireducens DSM 14787]|uniref:Formate dehydrogenase O gamma subunit n=1 Tax=Thioalkalivibrio nitratireducens (strain DSM 14787 / UNIQEM 213 / ALEN2) TaxID=1255043 RepID=L0DWC4_THIND|nr:formate dehydrogenase subunit gamma [Thioalkalivibrio nitratireducens]AGA32666.1 Formate dehydrogenase O gamma subunit [Thioalkalivibrio nitratireducens DSM 14787]